MGATTPVEAVPVAIWMTGGVCLQVETDPREFYLFKVLRAHILPLTNCAFNKAGDKFITGSYDRTCKIWDTATGGELLTLEGHKNVVYAIAFNNPFGDKVVTGSFDKTAKIWDATTGENYHTYKGKAFPTHTWQRRDNFGIEMGWLQGTARKLFA